MSQLESVAALQPTTAVDLPNFAPMGKGVDVLFLDLQDPGVAERQVVFAYQDDATSTDKQYKYPSQMTFTPRWATTLTATSSVIQSAYDMRQMISTSMSLGGQFEEFAFTASAAYKYATATTGKFATVINEAAAVATLWQVSLIPTTPHPFADQFVKDVKKLATSVDMSACQAFITSYGTHYFTKAAFGGRSYQRFNAKSANMATLVTDQISVSAQASFGLGLSFNQGTKHKGSAYDTFLANVTAGQLSWTGGQPSTDWNAWVASVKSAPVVVASSLSPIHELFTAANFSQIGNITQIKSCMQRAVESYLPQAGVDPTEGQLSYQTIATDPPLPVTVGFSPLLQPAERLSAKPSKGEGDNNYAVKIDQTPPAVIGLEPIDPSGYQSTAPCPGGAPVALAPAVQPEQETLDLWVLQQWGTDQVNLGAYEAGEVPAPPAATWQLLVPFSSQPSGAPLFDGAVVQLQNHESQNLISADGGQPGITNDTYSVATYWVLHVIPAE